MMEKDDGTAKQWLDENELIPLAVLAIELGEPLETVAHHLADHVQLDDVGIRVVSTEAARGFLTARREQEARIKDQARRRQQALGPLPVVAGVPALSDDASPLASLMAAASDCQTPVDEFSGRERPNFVIEAIGQGERQLAAAQAEAAAKKATREGKDR